MFEPVKLLDINISPASGNVNDLKNPGNYKKVKAFIRWDNLSIGFIEVQFKDGFVSKNEIIKQIITLHSKKLISLILQKRYEKTIEEENKDQKDLPLVSVAVCTRNRSGNLELCIDSLLKLKYPNYEILIIDNAPSDYSTKNLVIEFCGRLKSSGKNIELRYICEPIPGLNWARNRAVHESSGGIIAFTDDDVVVDQYWISEIVSIFIDKPDAMSVTGLVIPYELEKLPHLLFEEYGGFGRGFNRQWYRWSGVDIYGKKESAAKFFGGTGKFGTGANMAFRKKIFEKTGLFDISLDVGTPANGGGDLEMFFRIIKSGSLLVYQPDAVVRHRHRETYNELKTQLENNGIGFYAYLARSFTAYKDERFRIIHLGLWWLLYWSVRRLILSFIKAGYFPKDLIMAELKGSLSGPFRYFKSRKEADKLRKMYNQADEKYLTGFQPEDYSVYEKSFLKTVDVFDNPLPVEDFNMYYSSRFILTSDGNFVSAFEIRNNYSGISKLRLKDEIFGSVSFESFGIDENLNEESFEKIISQSSLPLKPAINRKRLSEKVKVSIVIPTFDRPNELKKCLSSLTDITTEREVEVIVVDNNPSSQIAPKVLAEFGNFKLVKEYRKGLSSARNRGIMGCTGEIVVCIDDDVTVSSNWLENLLEPFNNPEVMCTTGNVLPLQQDTKAERLFELYGGLGRGSSPKDFGPAWFKENKFYALPTWEIGATANAAFRTKIFKEEKIGLMNEALGAGTPSGCSEDTYLFYKILKAGYLIRYQPSAYVFHSHRKTMAEFYRQIFNYSKGHVAYNLLTFFNDKDTRGLVRILFELPLSHLLNIKRSVLKQSSYPLILTIIEITGNLAGPAALLHSVLKVSRNKSKVGLEPGSDHQTKILYKIS